MDDKTSVYGLVTKGNGDAFINENTHTALSAGGGLAGQGYPCVLIQKLTESVFGTDFYNQDVYHEVEPTLGINCGLSTGRNGVLIACKSKDRIQSAENERSDYGKER